MLVATAVLSLVFFAAGLVVAYAAFELGRSVKRDIQRQPTMEYKQDPSWLAIMRSMDPPTK